MSIPYRNGRNSDESRGFDGSADSVSIPYRNGRNSSRPCFPDLPCRVSIPYRNGRNDESIIRYCFFYSCQSLIGTVATTVLSTVSGSRGLKTTSFLPFFLVTQYTIFEIVFQHFLRFSCPEKSRKGNRLSALNLQFIPSIPVQLYNEGNIIFNRKENTP